MIPNITIYFFCSLQLYWYRQINHSILTPVSLKIAKKTEMSIENVKIHHRSKEWQDTLCNRMFLLIDLLSNHWIIIFYYKVPSFNLYFDLKNPSEYSETCFSNKTFTVHVTYNLASWKTWYILIERDRF